MKISQIKIKGFRNFDEATINLSFQTLIIGQNDIGKTNLLLALRLLLDPSLSYEDLIPQDTDFHLGASATKIEIALRIEEINEDCIKSEFGRYMNDDGSVYLIYEGHKSPVDGTEAFQVFASPDSSVDNYQAINRNAYLKVLKIKYIHSNRDLFDYIKKEKRALLQKARDLRVDATTIAQDDSHFERIKSSLQNVNSAVRQLSYITNATSTLNEELEKLSFHHRGHKIIFDVGESNPIHFVENLRLAAEIGENAVAIGGDGRNNQIFFALWATQNEFQNSFDNEVNIYCIEEPEAHLHPHQQRKLSHYFVNNAKSQLFITSHSPQIAGEFAPNSIVRLYTDGEKTLAANEGCGSHLEQTFVEFAHRMSIIPAEAFFSNIVLLVEGVSELLFFKALAPQIGIDLDKYNISILSVEGIGFFPFTEMLRALEIPWVIRTDNDLIKKGGRQRAGEERKYYARGVSIGIEHSQKYHETTVDLESLIRDHTGLLKNLDSSTPEPATLTLIELFRTNFKNHSFYLANIDLEHDIFHSPLKDVVKAHYHDIVADDDIIAAMADAKGENMYEFLLSNANSLSVLAEEQISEPLKKCKEYVEQLWQRNNQPQSN